MIEEIGAYVFYCVPSNGACPIRSMEVIIYAKDKDEAHRIFLESAHTFFDFDLVTSVREVRRGYRQK